MGPKHNGVYRTTRGLETTKVLSDHNGDGGPCRDYRGVQVPQWGSWTTMGPGNHNGAWGPRWDQGTKWVLGIIRDPRGHHEIIHKGSRRQQLALGTRLGKTNKGAQGPQRDPGITIKEAQGPQRGLGAQLGPTILIWCLGIILGPGDQNGVSITREPMDHKRPWGPQQIPGTTADPGDHNGA